MNTKFILLTVAALGLMVTPALAKKADGHHEKGMLEKMDTNSDGAISKDEWNAFSMKKFAKLDKDSDGHITKEEIKAHEEEEENEEKEKKSDKAGDKDVDKAGQ
jgi:Ca2+-binding EF-hand superfamily protein